MIRKIATVMRFGISSVGFDDAVLRDRGSGSRAYRTGRERESPRLSRSLYRRASSSPRRRSKSAWSISPAARRSARRCSSATTASGGDGGVGGGGAPTTARAGRPQRRRRGPRQLEAELVSRVEQRGLEPLRPAQHPQSADAGDRGGPDLEVAVPEHAAEHGLGQPGIGDPLERRVGRPLVDDPPGVDDPPVREHDLLAPEREGVHPIESTPYTTSASVSSRAGRARASCPGPWPGRTG